MYHVCGSDASRPAPISSLLCPNGTLYNQQYFVCDWWFNVDCSVVSVAQYCTGCLYITDYGGLKTFLCHLRKTSFLQMTLSQKCFEGFPLCTIKLLSPLLHLKSQPCLLRCHFKFILKIHLDDFKNIVNFVIIFRLSCMFQHPYFPHCVKPSSRPPGVKTLW